MPTWIDLLVLYNQIAAPHGFWRLFLAGMPAALQSAMCISNVLWYSSYSVVHEGRWKYIQLH